MILQPRPQWEAMVAPIKSLAKLEAFRIARLLEGKDTRSARNAIKRRHDQLIGLRGKRRLRGNARKMGGEA